MKIKLPCYGYVVNCSIKEFKLNYHIRDDYAVIRFMDM